MGKRKKIVVLFMLIAVFAVGFSVQASAGWKSVNTTGDKQYYDSKGKLVKNKWVGTRHLNANGFMDRNKWLRDKNNKRCYVGNDGRKVTGIVKIKNAYYYFDSKGVNQTGWKTVNGKKYYFLSTTRKALVDCVYKFKNGKTYCFDKTGRMLKGWQKIKGSYYYFKNNLKKGWLTLNGKKYYLIKAQNGKRAEGIFSVSGKLYYFDPDTGVMQKNTTVTWKGEKYTVGKNGVCTLVPDTISPSEKMVFFLRYESGTESYNQTGGDHGCACGAYQFDYRYSLLSFVKYAYKENPTLCKPFKTYAAYKDSKKTKLYNNTKFYNAWKKVYKTDPKAFAALQDSYAKINYYDNVERALEAAGIKISTRSDVVKGAVFSYSIQHGATTAVNAVKSIKPTSSMSDTKFIKKLYAKRIKSFPAYSTRYTSERDLALSLL